MTGFRIPFGRRSSGMACSRNAIRLAAYASGALDSAARAEVDAHLRGCGTCREELAAQVAMDALLRINPPPVSEPSSDLWTRIEAQIRTDSPALPGTDRSRQPGRGFRLPGGIAAWGMVSAAAVVALVVCTGIVPLHPAPSADSLRVADSGNGISPVQTSSAAGRLTEQVAMAASRPDAAPFTASPSPIIGSVAIDATKAQERPVVARTTATGHHSHVAVVRAAKAVEVATIAHTVTHISEGDLPAVVSPAKLAQDGTATTPQAAGPAQARLSTVDSASVAGPAAPPALSESHVAVSDHVASLRPVISRNDTAALTSETVAPEDEASSVTLANAITELSAPVRRQAGLFSYQAR